MSDIIPPPSGLDAYTTGAWTLVVSPSGHCTIIGPIAATFTTSEKALAWINERR